MRRRILTPNVSATRLDKRGFYQKNASARSLLETIGETFLTGYGCAAESRVPADVQAHLDVIPTQFRGFAYEGAAIWAMARVPRLRWSKLHAPDPLLRWLVLDGYGFHQAYFHTRRYVYERYRRPAFPWPPDGPRWYADRVIDQGIGRAMWFVGGADAQQVATLLDTFPEHRRPDLYSGAGLAATYAGGADEGELRWFFRHAGDYRRDVAQGSAFAASARVRAGLVVPHTGLATGIFCGMSPAEASAVTEETLPDRPDTADEPAYEVWRRRVARRLLPAAD